MTDKNWFDPNTYVEMMKSGDVAKMFEGMQIPGFDTTAMTDAQKKNVQAFVEANKVAAEGYQALFKTQAEVMQASVAELTEAVKEMNTQPMSTEGVEKRVEIARAQFEKGVQRLTEVAESIRKTNEDSLAIIQARFNEGVAEMKDMSESAMKTA